jgi:hypothetical protein
MFSPAASAFLWPQMSLPGIPLHPGALPEDTDVGSETVSHRDGPYPGIGIALTV